MNQTVRSRNIYDWSCLGRRRNTVSRHPLSHDQAGWISEARFVGDFARLCRDSPQYRNIRAAVGARAAFDIAL